MCANSLTAAWAEVVSPLQAAAPQSLVLRRARGSFADAAANATLHIGISSSAELGVVFNYDEHGCRADAISLWPEAVSIPLPLPPLAEDWDSFVFEHHEAWEQSPVP